MTTYYLVTGTVEIKEYESSRKPKIEHATRLVIAESERQARDKFENHFNAMTSEYSVYYTVYGIEVHETIT
jgi:hypothetical protein